MSLSTSGGHGINGDLFVNGLIQGSTISGSTIVVSGNDITNAILGVGAFETTLSGIVSGSTSVPKATLAQNSNFAYNMNIQNNLDNDPTNSSNWYFGLVNNNSGQVAFEATSSLNYTKSTNQTNIQSNCQINYSPSQTTRIVGTLSCDTSANILGKLTASGGITIPAGQTLNGISTATLGYIDPTSSIQTQLNNKVALTGAQTIAGVKTFTNQAVFNGGIVINGNEEETGNLTLSGNLVVAGSNTTTLTGSCTIGQIGSVFDALTVNIATKLKASVFFDTLPYLQATPTMLYLKSGYGGVVTVAAATTLSTSVIYEYYHLKTTVTTTPILTIPDPTVNLVGCEIKFFRTATANAVGLQCATNTNGFIIGSNVITPTFILGSTGGSSMWYKLFLVCLPNPDASGTYVWYQSHYQ